MSRKYIFLDIDGTLYSQQLAATPASAELALKKARENGHKIFLCTGRSLAESSRYLNYDVDGFILGAGTMVYAGGKRIYDNPIPTRDVTRIKKKILQAGLGYSLEGGVGVYCDPIGYDRIQWYFSGGSEDPEVRKKSALDNCAYPEKFGSEDSDNIYKICALGSKWDEKYKDLENRLEKPYVLTMSVDLDGFSCGEITDDNITKATGIDRVLEYYNAETFDAIGIGDSANDIPMLKKCGIGIAMGDGQQDAKDAADYVTTGILEDGIYNAFKHFGLIDD
ncbi:MAG: HAD family hydrolase [Solobacterium sp.]|jgi:Cof subfamily protein (haloacid dehalogenase superfamily)|nr:HAD family hydrolase [Solobacterium sp.]MCH4048030.1 HAD family hydrolase [Solobacterium sp.]MCH4075384.1 HAD family hydrolase [Solobacterium sp.]MCI1313766.1 HAD family hydrolase [Solobacterium sp.]MCI1407163.1 HAD family hydrolase [Solobacterium sp.]